MPSSFSPATSTHGFTAVPRALFDRLLVVDLTKRELIVLLLIVRLTYGVRNTPWIRLRQTDLSAVGISASHARSTLEALLTKGFIAFDEDRKAYQIAREFIRGEAEGEANARRVAHLARLVAHQLVPTATASDLGLSKKGSPNLPKREHTTSQNGKGSSADSWQFSRSRPGFVRAVELPIDRERQI
jgi:hypothetical protein